MFLKKREKSFSHLGKTVTSFGWRICKESVACTSFRGGFAACLLFGVLSPVVFLAFWAEFPDESLFFEERQRIFFRRKSFQIVRALRLQMSIFRVFKGITRFTDLNGVPEISVIRARVADNFFPFESLHRKNFKKKKYHALLGGLSENT